MIIPEVNHQIQLLIGRARDASATLPPGAVIDYVHGPSRGGQILIASGFTIAAAFIVVITRICIKLFVTHSPGWDDCTFPTTPNRYPPFSLIATKIRRLLHLLSPLREWLAMSFVRCPQPLILPTDLHAGSGQKVWSGTSSIRRACIPLSPPFDCLFTHSSLNRDLRRSYLLLTFARQWYQIDNVFYLMAVLFAKLSILLLYLRLFKVNRTFRLFDFALMSLVVSYCISLALSILFACEPLARTWDSSIPGTCPVDILKVDFAIGGFNIFTDTAILILPIPIVWRLQISTTRLIGLMLVFGTGAL